MGALLTFLTGCTTEDERPSPAPTPSGKPNTSPQPKPLGISQLAELRKRLAQEREWDLAAGGPNEDRHKAFFVLRRSEIIANDRPTWSEDQIVTRIRNELNAVEAFLVQKLANDQLGGATEDGASAGDKAAPYAADPHKHLNLADVAYPKTNTSDPEARRRRTGLVAFRVRQVRAIVWRAAAIHRELWDALAQPSPVTLNTAKLAATLDRRLRAVERMNTQVATHKHLLGFYDPLRGSTLGPETRLALGNAGFNWRDGFRVRPFEYPRVQLKAKSTSGVYAPKAESVIGQANIADPNTEVPFEGGKPWRYSASVGNARLEYNVPPEPGLQIPPDLATRWQQRQKLEEETLLGRRDGNTLYTLYDVNLNPDAGSPGESVHNLFQPDFDWWSRTWVYCDHVLSALNIEALRFQLRRTPNPNNDSAFDQLASQAQASGQKEYVQLTHHVDLFARSVGGQLVRDVMMGGWDNDTYFDNVEVQSGDLQVGDMLQMFNSFVYFFIAEDEWRFEYSLVLDIVSDFESSAGLVLKKLVLIGHGIEARPYGGYKERVASHCQAGLNAILKRAVAQPASVNSFRHGRSEILVVRWDPYGEFPNQATWWLVLPLNSRHSLWTSPQQAKAAIAKVVIVDDAPNPTNAFPTQLVDPPPAGVPNRGFVLFPLFEPSLENSSDPWNDYLQRRGNANFVVPKKLLPIKVDANTVPGIYKRGQSSPIRVVRPRVSA